MKIIFVLVIVLSIISLAKTADDKIFTVDNFAQCLNQQCTKNAPDCMADKICKDQTAQINQALFDDKNEDCKSLRTELDELKPDEKFPSETYLKCLQYASGDKDRVKEENEISSSIMQCNCLCAENLEDPSKTQCKYGTFPLPEDDEEEKKE